MRVRCVCVLHFGHLFFIHFLSTQSTLSKKKCILLLLIRGHRRYGNETIQHSTWGYCLRSFATLGGIKCVYKIQSTRSLPLSLSLALTGKRGRNSTLHTSHTSLINIWPLRRVLKRRRKKTLFALNERNKKALLNNNIYQSKQKIKVFSTHWNLNFATSASKSKEHCLCHEKNQSLCVWWSCVDADERPNVMFNNELRFFLLRFFALRRSRFSTAHESSTFLIIETREKKNTTTSRMEDWRAIQSHNYVAKMMKNYLIWFGAKHRATHTVIMVFLCAIFQD